MADADDDGFHIIELLLSAIWTLMPDLIRHGHVYVANAPLFRFDRYVKGKREIAFALDMDEYAQMKEDHKGWKVTRLKGLGEMNPDELKVTTMAQDTRQLSRVVVHDEKEFTQRLELFMGRNKKNGMSASEARRIWLSENVEFVED